MWSPMLLICVLARAARATAHYPNRLPASRHSSSTQPAEIVALGLVAVVGARKAIGLRTLLAAGLLEAPAGARTGRSGPCL